MDTGPLVAFLMADEQHHDWARERMKELPPRFISCEAVLAEASYLLGFEAAAMEQLERFFENGILVIEFQFALERKRVMELMRAYRNIPMSLADACLVRLSELHPEAPVFTLDHDFRIYRRNRRQAIKVIMPG